MEIHPQTRQRYTRDRRNTDIILPLKGQEALSQEKIPVIGGFKDFTGSGGVPTKRLMYAPTPDEIWGTDAWVDGGRDRELNPLGENIRTTRLRQRNQHIIFPPS